mmetsp:Transcript_13723/g.35257  ORF Transcript_13723/g.35257 Transcript_13723/m.35257 type:complete len:122 (-) Transcript_13723:40-405(-)
MLRWAATAFLPRYTAAAAALPFRCGTPHRYEPCRRLRGGGDTVGVTFVEGGKETWVAATPGKSLLDAAHTAGIKLEGRCEGSLRCSTCHVVIMGHDMYKALGTPCEEEQDMLGITFRATPT